jgi:hypothetical protein
MFDPENIEIGWHLVLPGLVQPISHALRCQDRATSLRMFGLIHYLNGLDGSEEENATIISCLDSVVLDDRYADAVQYLSLKAREQVAHYAERMFRPDIAEPRLRALRRKIRFDRGVEVEARQIAKAVG